MPKRDEPRRARAAPDREIRERLRRIIADHSQAAVARRTGTPQPSLSRYLRDRRIPADFCARLAATMDVNPDWLLAGEGVPYRADVPPRAQEEVGSLLELVQGLNAVQRLNLAAVVDREPRRALHRLGSEIEAFETLRERLGEQVRTLFESAIGEVDRAFGQSRLEQAEQLLRALDRVRTLCPDEGLCARLDEARAFFESERGNLEEAVRIRRQLVHGALLGGDLPIETRLNIDHNYVATLFHTFHLTEAHRTSRVLATLHEEHRALAGYWVFPCSTHIIEAELGRLDDSLRGLIHVLPRLPEPNRSINHANLVQAQVLGGTVALAEAAAAERVRSAKLGPMPRETSARALARLALLVETPEALELIAYARADLLRSDEKSHAGLGRQVELLRRATAEDGERAYGTFRADPGVRAQLTAPAARVRFSALVHCTQLARLARSAEARARLEEAEAARRALEPGQTPWLPLRALHFKSALALLPPRARARSAMELREDAERFFAEHHAAGYAFLAEIAATAG